MLNLLCKILPYTLSNACPALINVALNLLYDEYANFPSFRLNYCYIQCKILLAYLKSEQ